MQKTRETQCTECTHLGKRITINILSRVRRTFRLDTKRLRFVKLLATDTLMNQNVRFVGMRVNRERCNCHWRKQWKKQTPRRLGEKRKCRGKCVLYVNHTACIVFCDYCYYYIAPLFRLSIADAAVLFRAVRLIVHIFIKSFQPPKITNDGHLHYTVLLSQPTFVYTQLRVK